MRAIFYRRAGLAREVGAQGLGAALALVIAGARADGVHMPPVALMLRVDLRVAIDFAGRGLQHARARATRQLQHIERALHTRLQGVYRVGLIVGGRGRTREVIDAVQPIQFDGLGHILAQHAQALAPDQGLQVGGLAGLEIVQADHLVAGQQQMLA